MALVGNVPGSRTRMGRGGGARGEGWGGDMEVYAWVQTIIVLRPIQVHSTGSHRHRFTGSQVHTDSTRFSGIQGIAGVIACGWILYVLGAKPLPGGRLAQPASGEVLWCRVAAVAHRQLVSCHWVAALRVETCGY